MRIHSILVLVLSLGLLTLAPAASFAQGQDQLSQSAQLFQEGVRAYEQGAFEEAERKFREALNANPSNSDIALMREMAGWELIFRMHRGIDGENFRRIAEYLVARQRDIGTPERATPAQIKEWVRQAVIDSNFELRFRAKLNLSNQAGDLAVPFLQEYLESDSQERNVNAIEVAVFLSGQATLPLLEMLDSDNEQLRKNVAICLGRLGDERATADLKYLVETDESAEVREASRRSLTMITGGNAWERTPSRELFVARGEQFFVNNASMIQNWQSRWLVWRWNRNVDDLNDAGSLQKRQVRYFQYNESLAEESAYNAVRADPTYGPAWSLLIDVHLQQYMEAESHLAMPGEGGDEDEKATIMKEVQNKLLLGGPAGEFAFYSALGRALRFNKSYVAIKALDILSRIGTPDALPGPNDQFPTGRPSDAIIQALSNDDRRVKYAAATALLKISPLDLFNFAPTAMTELAHALSEGGEHAVLVISDDLALKNQLIPIFETHNFIYYFASDVDEGLLRAKGFPNEDLLVVDYKVLSSPVRQQAMEDQRFVPVMGGPVQSEVMYDALQRDYRTNNIPIIVMAAAADLEAAKRSFQGKRNIKEFIAPDDASRFDEAIVVGAMTQAWNDAPQRGPIRGTDWAIRAAETLEDLAPSSPHWQNRAVVIQSLVSNAAAAAEGARSDDVVSASMRALKAIIRKVDDLAMVRDRVLPALHVVVSGAGPDDEGGSKASEIARGAVADAIGEIWRVYGRELYRSDTYEALIKNLKTMNDHESRMNVSLALGRMELRPDETLAIYSQVRTWGESPWSKGTE
ncbi:MAG: HEAT repeat domain-containing protein [Planctomycetes bacterium]|nr:HEAT repeat domain-containing protein [Planctomycetota bacterium]